MPFIERPASVVSVRTFLELLDTPNTYSGAAGYFVRVKPDGTGLEFVPTGGGGATTFLELTDTPSSYSGQGGKLVRVKSDGTGLEFISPSSIPPAPHASSHQAGGSDQINVAGLPGELADYQKAKLAIVGTRSSFPAAGIAGRLAYATDENALYRDTGSSWVKVHPTSFLELTDTPSSYSGNAGKVVRVKSDASGLEFADLAGGGATTFLGLQDTPSSYSGAGGKYVRVKTDETGLEFVTGTGGGAASFLELNDTPSSYAGQAGKIVRVKSDASGLEFADLPAGGAGTFLDLTDTPSSYSGSAGYLVRVKSTGDGLEFISATSVSTPPLSHAASHEEGGSDALNPANIGANWTKIVNKPSAFPPESHASSHRPGGADALPTAIPAAITVNASASEGTSTSFARADHVHATPSTWPPSAHASSHEDGGADALNPANIGANWNKLVNKPSTFPPSTHATSHAPGGSDALPTAAPAAITVGATGSEGTSSSFARADHVHATPSAWPPTSHASSHEEGGSDALDPSKLGANWNKLVNKPSAFPPESHATSHRPGGSDALPTGTPAAITVGASASEGTSMSFARADHVHATPSTWPPSAHASSHQPGGSDALPTGTPAAITVGASASAGTSTSFARADHVHATPSTWTPSTHGNEAHNPSFLPLSGGTMTGILTAQNNTSYTTFQVRNIVLSTNDPSGGGNGDVWMKYTD